MSVALSSTCLCFPHFVLCWVPCAYIRQSWTRGGQSQAKQHQWNKENTSNFDWLLLQVLELVFLHVFCKSWSFLAIWLLPSKKQHIYKPMLWFLDYSSSSSQWSHAHKTFFAGLVPWFLVNGIVEGRGWSCFVVVLAVAQQTIACHLDFWIPCAFVFCRFFPPGSGSLLVDNLCDGVNILWCVCRQAWAAACRGRIIWMQHLMTQSAFDSSGHWKLNAPSDFFLIASKLQHSSRAHLSAVHAAVERGAKV